MAPDALARIFMLPLSRFGRQFVLAEVLGEPVSRRLASLGRARPLPPPAPAPSAARTPPAGSTKG